MKYKFLEHTADIKIQAYGKTIEEAYKNGALALKESICWKIKVKGKKEKKIKISGKDFESLLYNFLEEFLYFLDAEDFLLSKIKNLKINKKDFTLAATFLGDNASNYEFSNNVKAITYNEMKLKENKGKWVVLDVRNL